MLTTADGKPTNAIFGFIQMLLGTIDKFDPDYILCSLESETPTFRHKLSAEYKSNRKEPDNELTVQIPEIIKVIHALNIKTLQKDGFEADDVIGSYAVQNQGNFDRIDIVTGDRDLLQLISDKIHVFIPGKSFSDLIEYDRYKFKEKFGIELEDYILYKTLVGDASDNIKGVPGIGPKTAAGIVNQFHSIQSLLANTDQLSQRFAVAIEENKDLLERYYQLSQIDTSIECELKADDIKVSKINASRLRSLIREYEFSSMSKRAAKFIDNFEKKHGGFGLFAEFDNNVSHEIDHSLSEEVSFGDETFLIQTVDSFRFGNGKEFIDVEKTDLYNFIILNNIKKIIGFDLKPFIKKLFDAGLTKIEDYEFIDLKLSWYLIRNSLEFESLNEIANHLNTSNYIEIYQKTLDELSKDNLKNLFELEKKVQIILATMEFEGIYCDAGYLKKLEIEFKEKIIKIKVKIFDFIGHEFNPASTKELGHILFDVLKLPVFKKNKTGYSTDDNTLTKLEGMSEIIPMIKEFRLYSKILSTYIIGLQNAIDQNGKIHTTYVQDQVPTGRLSSINPNLQNLPNDERIGPMIRKAFCTKGGIYLSLDYSQVELRILAFESKDPGLMEAFINEEDIHISTARIIFDKDEISKDERSFAKTINFGIVYGMEPYGLSQALGISQGEAKIFIDKYFEKFHGVKEYFNRITKTLDEKCYVQTFLGRRRYFDSWNATKGFQKRILFREAINMPIQGGNADIMKMAMVKIYDLIRKKNLQCKLLLQIHDELILHITNETELQNITDQIAEIMSNAYDINVPLKVSSKFGSDLSFN